MNRYIHNKISIKLNPAIKDGISQVLDQQHLITINAIAITIETARNGNGTTTYFSSFEAIVVVVFVPLLTIIVVFPS